MDFIYDIDLNNHKILNCQYVQGPSESADKVANPLIVKSLSNSGEQFTESYDGSKKITIDLLEKIKNLINKSGAITSIKDPIGNTLTPDADGNIVYTLENNCVFENDDSVNEFIKRYGTTGANTIQNGLMIMIRNSNVNDYLYDPKSGVISEKVLRSAIKIYDKSKNEFVPLSLESRITDLINSQVSYINDSIGKSLTAQYTSTSKWIQGVQSTLISTVQEVKRLGNKDTFWARLVNECARHGIRIASGVIGAATVQSLNLSDFSDITNKDKVKEP